MIELHGNMSEARCVECNRIWPCSELDLDGLPQDEEVAPRCRDCNGLLRENTIAFDQDLDGATLSRCVELMKRCHTIVIVGTSAVVSPAREMPMLAKLHGASVVVVNPERTHHSDVADLTVLGKASCLPDILQLV